MKLRELNELSDFILQLEDEEQAHFDMLLSLAQPEKLISNVQTELKATILNDVVLPVTINDSAYNTSYVCSIYTAFISYGRTELNKIKSRFVKKCLTVLLAVLDKLLKKAKIDQVVSHNNMLLSTNLYPDSDYDITALSSHVDSMLLRYPDHALIFRSLNPYTNQKLMDALQQLGFTLCPTRQVYLFDINLNDYRRRHNYQIDLRLLHKQTRFSPCFNHQINQNDYKKISQLYHKLYIEKYSEFNPIFTEEYIAAAHQHGFIEYFGLRNNAGILVAIVGCFDRYPVTTVPIVGYDTSLDPRLGLYRMLMAHCIQRAQRKNMILNLSSGASHFKLLRGGVPYIEYSALYTRHLRNYFQKSTWFVLRRLLLSIGVPIMRKYQL